MVRIMGVSDACELGARAGAVFPQQVGHVVLHGVRRDPELVADALVRDPGRDPMFAIMVSYLSFSIPTSLTPIMTIRLTKFN